MRRMTGPIESGCRLTSSPRADPQRNRKPAATVASKFDIRMMANLSRSRSSQPMIGTECQEQEWCPSGNRLLSARRPQAKATALTSMSHVQTNIRRLLPLFVGKIVALRDRVAHYSCGPALHDVRSYTQGQTGHKAPR
jgi:hypothetical protein